MEGNKSGVTGEPHPPTTSATARGMQSALKYDRCHVKIENNSTTLRRKAKFSYSGSEICLRVRFLDQIDLIVGLSCHCDS